VANHIRARNVIATRAPPTPQFFNQRGLPLSSFSIADLPQVWEIPETWELYSLVAVLFQSRRCRLLTRAAADQWATGETTLTGASLYSLEKMDDLAN
jgi:hypothetical protein